MTEARPLPGKGAALFATRSYAEGDAILAEAPLVVLSSAAASSDAIRAQFNAASVVASNKSKSGDGGGNETVRHGDLLLPQAILTQLSQVFTGYQLHYRTGKVRGMLLALANYATNPPSEETKEKLLALYHPSLEGEVNEAEKEALGLANLALQCGKKMAADNSALKTLLKKHKEEALRLLLVYSCNSFEGGRIYEQISRANHACNPNAVVVERDDGEASKDVSVLKAACNIEKGEEICISYLGRYLYAGYPIRQRVLRAHKHFVCACARCGSGRSEEVDSNGDANAGKGGAVVGDLASRIPCPVCHPREGRYLDEDVMFDEGGSDEEGLEVCYAVPANGLTAADRTLHCPRCEGNAAAPDDASAKKKREDCLKYTCLAEDKAFDRLESCDAASLKKKAQSDIAADDAEEEQEMDRHFLQMATSVCGAKHWATHFLNLSIIEESLASFHATLMAMGQDTDKDAGMLEELLVEIAEAADGIDKAYAYATSLELNLDPAHWLFDYTVGLARTLVGLGDEKSQKYAATWIAKVEGYADKFENEGMRKVVMALRDAWKRGKAEDGGRKSDRQEDQTHAKRRRVE